VVTDLLAELAESYGVATQYWDQGGRHHEVAESTVVAVLAALGVDAADPAHLRAALAERRLAPWRRTLPPVFVTREGADATCWVHVPHLTRVSLVVELEDGGRLGLAQVPHLVEPVDVDGTLTGEAMFRIPPGLPTGWHVLHADLESGAAACCPLVVTPARLTLPSPLSDRRGWGVALQLYALRSRRSWGVGDLADLADLVRFAALELAADFVLVNPVHAGDPAAPIEPSPYLPASRRFANPAYLRVEDVPEFAYLPELDRARVAELAAGPTAASRTADLLDRDASWTAKLAALELVRRVPLTPGRAASYRAYREREGDALADFATWCALVEEHGRMPDWPSQLRDARSVAVDRERERLSARVEFYQWCQWVLDDQLANAQEAALRSGMPVGVIHDLAVGVDSEGADAWSMRSVLAQGVTVGAPPDMYNQQGQDWAQPPWRPDALADAAFLPYRDMLRTVLRHAGGIRVDHVLGLFRLWWVPDGAPASEGTYVRYDHEALVGILALEAQRAGALVIGEDLGTVEQWVQDLLRDRGILGTSILWFERRADGSVPAPTDWRADVLASVTTHDLPPTEGYLSGEHVRLRDDLGLLNRPAGEEWAAHASDVAAWRAALTTYRLLPPEADDGDVLLALHRFLARTPARLVAVSLADAVGERRAQNQPGTWHEYANWRLPLTDGEGRTVLLESLPRVERLRRLAAVFAAGAG
jgi:4-alpha-glucanotransferase